MVDKFKTTTLVNAIIADNKEYMQDLTVAEYIIMNGEQSSDWTPLLPAEANHIEIEELKEFLLKYFSYDFSDDNVNDLIDEDYVAKKIEECEDNINDVMEDGESKAQYFLKDIELHAKYFLNKEEYSQDELNALKDYLKENYSNKYGCDYRFSITLFSDPYYGDDCNHISSYATSKMARENLAHDVTTSCYFKDYLAEQGSAVIYDTIKCEELLSIPLIELN